MGAATAAPFEPRVQFLQRRTEGSNKWEGNGPACEIQNRIGKKNIINYGSPGAASSLSLCMICLHCTFLCG